MLFGKKKGKARRGSPPPDALDVPMHDIEQLVSLLARIQTEGAGGALVLVANQEHNIYVQVAAISQQPDLWLEAVSNDFISQDMQLSSAQQQQLIDLGWSLPSAGQRQSQPNYVQEVQAHDDDTRRKAVELLLLTLQQAYDIPGSTMLSVQVIFN
ncbi:MAG: hypothetical protein GYB68_19430 [Chloroflexi bacterium]|nr:hypothetical protein [Chloroflexota bacterium]